MAFLRYTIGMGIDLKFVFNPIYPSAFADFNTLAMIAAYFAWRRGQGRPRDNNHAFWCVMCSIIIVWVFCLCLTSMPLYGICGEFGYDPIHAKCHLLPCEKCSLGGVYFIPPALLMEAIGVGVPSLIIIVSYIFVHMKLSQASENDEVGSLKKAVLILTVCYFAFILPNSLTAWLPEEVSKWAFIGTILGCWYWLIYTVNFFIYILFWRRVRMAIFLFLKDVLEILGLKRNSAGLSILETETDHWWMELRKQLQQNQTVEAERECEESTAKLSGQSGQEIIYIFKKQELYVVNTVKETEKIESLKQFENLLDEVEYWKDKYFQKKEGV